MYKCDLTRRTGARCSSELPNSINGSVLHSQREQYNRKGKTTYRQKLQDETRVVMLEEIHSSLTRIRIATLQHRYVYTSH